MVDYLELFSELKHFSTVREIIFDDISSNGLSGHFMIQFSHLAGLNLVLTWDYRNNIINLILSAFMIIFPQNSFWLYDVMIALVKQPWDVCLVISLTPLSPLSEHRNILLLSSAPSQRFSWTWKIWAGWPGWPWSNIFSNLSSHLIWALCGQPDPRLWLKFSTIISAAAPALINEPSSRETQTVLGSF